MVRGRQQKHLAEQQHCWLTVVKCKTEQTRKSKHKLAYNNSIIVTEKIKKLYQRQLVAGRGVQVDEWLSTRKN